jgi:hypothetical protein
VGVLSIDLFVFFCNEDLEVAVCLPFILMELNFCNLLSEDCLTDYCSKETITDIFILFIEIHKSSQENREIYYIKE